MLLKQRKLVLAVAALERAVALDPRHLNAHLSLGLALTVLNCHNQATEVFRRFLELAPNHAEAPRIRQLLEQPADP